MKIFITLLTTTLLLCNSSIFAQCAGCTQTISVTQPGPLIVNTGEVVCISSTGVIQGDVYINGGTLCNFGVVNALYVSIDSGTLNNYGTFSTGYTHLYSGEIQNYSDFNSGYLNFELGWLQNDGVANVDTLSTNDSNSDLINNGTLNTMTVQIAISSAGNDFVSENNGTFNVTNEMVHSNATFNNNGILNIDGNFQNNTFGEFNNFGDMSVDGNFINYGVFYTDCMIPIDGDWTTSGSVIGPLAGGCGGFMVQGFTQAIGDIGADGSNLDVCDSGNPPGGFDQNLANNVGANVTNCVCASICQTFIGLEEVEKGTGISVYPNPMNGQATISIDNSDIHSFSVQILDVNGRLVYFNHINGSNEFSLDRNDIEAGIYIVRVAYANDMQGVERLIVQ
jgi:hypothetical protein